MTALHALLVGLVDYAGLFPPAALTMPEAVRLYDAHRRSRSGWALGRFVVPVARLAEFGQAADAVLPTGPGAVPWRLSALPGGDPAADLGEVLSFNACHGQADEGQARVDAIEVKAPLADVVESIARTFGGFSIACEVDPRSHALPDVLRAVKSAAGVAKLRAGGVTAEAVPGIDDVATFVWACACHEVPFKLTAGLHHAVRGEYPLTDDAESPRAVMHGLLNVLLAAVAARRLARAADGPSSRGAGPSVPSVMTDILRERDPQAFAVAAHHVAWRSLVFPVDEIESARRTFVVSVGSCSFEQPVTDLQSIGSA